MRTRLSAYGRPSRSGFFKAARARVLDELRNTGQPLSGNAWAHGFAGFLIVAYVAIYCGLVLERHGVLTSITLAAALGFVHALIGMNVGHTAVHGSLFATRRANRIAGYAFELIGFSSHIWYLKHVLGHHSFPNVQKIDFFIEGTPFMRLSPAEPRYWFHRYQHWYAPIFYVLFSIKWIFVDDVIFFPKYPTNPQGKPHRSREFVILVFAKLAYVFLMFVVPMYLTHLSLSEVLLGNLIVQVVHAFWWSAGLLPEHVFDETRFLDERNGQVDDDYVTVQMDTTMDFAVDSWSGPHLFGSLNLNLMHHLFPQICHVHLGRLQPIVADVAKEYGITYHTASYLDAYRSHFRALRRLGARADCAFPLSSTSPSSEQEQRRSLKTNLEMLDQR